MEGWPMDVVCSLLIVLSVSVYTVLHWEVG